MLLEQIERATEAERREAYSRLNYEFGRTSSANRMHDEFEMEVFDAINRTLGARAHMPAVVTMMGVANFKQACSVAANFIRDGSTGLLRKAHREVLLRMVMRSLRAHLELVGVAPSPTAMLRNMDSLWFAVDKDYPGYAECKLLNFMLVDR